MKIDAYQYPPKTIDPTVAEQLPFKKMPEFFEDVLDAITAACEQGRLSTDGWVKQCFSTKKVFNGFLEHLAEYDDLWRIHDRWYDALYQIAERAEECGFITTADIAAMLEEAAIETGQIKG